MLGYLSVGISACTAKRSGETMKRHMRMYGKRGIERDKKGSIRIHTRIGLSQGVYKKPTMQTIS
jgi:hypothetical protein